MRIRIVGSDLPGIRGGFPGAQVGVQRGTEVVDAIGVDSVGAGTDDTGSDGGTVTFDVEVKVVDTADGNDFRGPYVHGRRGERFLYLVWTQPDAEGRQVMFRRAKLQLAPVAELVTRAGADQGAIGALRLTDARGGPVCASVRPPAIDWRVASFD